MLISTVVIVTVNTEIHCVVTLGWETNMICYCKMFDKVVFVIAKFYWT